MNVPTMAVCIPTYERSDVVEDFLDSCYERYVNAGIDLYFYDSSKGDETKTVISKWIPKGHLYYVRMSSEVHPNAKAFKIFQGYGLEKPYDFLLLSSDGLQHKEELLKETMERLDIGLDMIVLDWVNNGEVGTRIITDPDELMVTSAHQMTTFGAVILNTHTMLSNVDWASYEKRFLTEPFTPWSHVCFYLNRILELDKFQSLNLSFPFKAVRFSIYKRNSVWMNDYFKYICEGWIETVESLPSSYVSRDKAIFKFSQDYLSDKSGFFQFKRRGTFSVKKWLQYYNMWPRITSVSRSRLLFIALLPRSIINGFYLLRLKRRTKLLKKFCASHTHIVIYGKGMQGFLFGKYLCDENITFDSFCVSRSESENEKFMRHPVFQFSESTLDMTKTGFIVGVAPSNAPEVVSTLKKATSSDHIFMDFPLVNEIRYRYGYGFVLTK